ncbi:MAG TPA: putative CRISPR-associated protein [candidate division WOR-3 bacterium]|uniref:CRISPR-associated protein n=1 Tax=candidate division WOR-3 bacterium TaxID=2052148 RepID=A0A7V0XFK1_UNCW3|nr:putative CRISPR-associated protein [candidate division WOR-3 bacterium]
MSKTIITLVGTSLLSNWLSDQLQKSQVTDEDSQKGAKEKLDAYRRHCATDDLSYASPVSEWVKALNPDLNYDALPALAAQLKNYIHSEPQKASAEVSSLSDSDLNGSRLVLVTTNTVECRVCAIALEQYYKAISSFSDGVCVTTIDGLKDSKTFPRGLTQLAAKLQELVCEVTNARNEVLINATGGFKPEAAYATLVGLLEGVPVFYRHESFKRNAKLPALPLGLDYREWSRRYPLLEAIHGRPQAQVDAYYNALPVSFQNLFDKDQDTYLLTPLGLTLLNQFRQERFGEQLREPAGLLDCLVRNDGKPDLRDFFTRLAEIGPKLWFGDKVPEMADHARYHHTNLLIIAELMLVPMMKPSDGRASLLKPEELFTLLCTIYFHDWGHVLSRLEGVDRPLLPTEVREYHHILGYERLKCQTWQKWLIEQGLCWTNNDPDKLWKDYLETIATIGLFHRQKMPLAGTEPYICQLTKEEYSPLCKRELKFENEPFCTKRAVFIAALFRIIDSLDNQWDRMGLEGEVEARAAVMENDLGTAKQRVRMAADILNGLPGAVARHAELCSKVLRAYRIITRGYGRQETDGKAGREVNADELVREMLKQVRGEHKPLVKATVCNLLEAAVSAWFKKEQPKHYLKHLCFQAPGIRTESDGNGGWEVKVSFRETEKDKIEKYKAKFNLTELPDAEKVIAGIKAEYEGKKDKNGKTKQPGVQEILKDNGVQVSYT